MRYSLNIIIASLLIGATGPVAAANPEDATLNAVYQRLAAARTAHDTQGMTKAFAPQALLIDARPGPAVSGNELAARIAPMAAQLKAESGTISTSYRIERRSVMGDVAVDVGYMRQHVARASGASMTRYARFLVTMSRVPGGAWRIIADASMPAEQAAFESVATQTGLHHDS